MFRVEKGEERLKILKKLEGGKRRTFQTFLGLFGGIKCLFGDNFGGMGGSEMVPDIFHRRIILLKGFRR